jgi:large subunit ribosomal protein L4
MATAKYFDKDGSYKSDLDLPDAFFGVEISKACVYLAINAYRAHQRQGTSNSKTRSEINGSGAKPWKQKGTGRARAGSNSSPIWVRGNKAHGPNPRTYFKKVNKKVRAKALLSALTSKAESGSINVIESLAFESPKTNAFLNIMTKANLEPKNTLYLVASSDQNALVSSRNVPWARVMRVEDVNTYQLIRARNIVFSKAALESLTGAAK